ncbi:MAG: mechanosensitive ion channel family protein [Bryobacteraceae bacterium]|jgi:MscS family membrane protein
MKLFPAIFLALGLAAPGLAQTVAAKPDTLGRDNPRSAVTGFLEACGDRDYQQASQYLDLSAIAAPNRAQRGPALAQQLEGVLNSDSHFSVLRLSRDPEGDRTDDADANREHIATITLDGSPVTLEMEREPLSPGGPQVWLFSPDTVAAIPKLAHSATPPAVAKYLPPFFSSIQIAETPLWEWVALILAALLLLAISRQLDRLLAVITRIAASRLHLAPYVPWFMAIVEPVRVILSLVAFRVALEVVGPAAIARLYIGRAAQALFVCSVAWCLIRLVELFISRVEAKLDTRRRFASRSMLHLGRRTANVTIVVLAVLLVLSNWGYNTATLVAGLGVGGIAIALAAQQTLANVFGGVSIIGDHPVGIGEFGKFGDLIGTVEDIGMRSTRIRTLNRTVVSVPNSSFAAYNLENYSSRDKILFNPTFPIKRTTPEDRVLHLVESLRQLLAANQLVECVPTPVRVTGLAAATLSVEVFCYVRTGDMDKFYTIQSDLLLAINRALQEANVELA